MKIIITALVVSLLTLTGCYEAPKALVIAAEDPALKIISTAPLPTSVIVVFDTSGSMEGERLAQAKAAFNQWVSTAPDGVVWSLFTFNSNPSVAFTKNKEVMRSHINSLTASGGTPLIDTCLLAADYMRKRTAVLKEPEQQVLLILTDGQDSNYSADKAQGVMASLTKEYTTYMISYVPDDTTFSKAVTNYSTVTNASSLKASLDDISLEK